jgi:tetratricopeptide (TPR) repeat protein
MSACSTKKNTWASRNYHNLAAHYNAYFNGNEALKKAKKDIAIAHVDDYSEVLNVFQLATQQTASASLPDLERSIQKASLVIHKHSMEFNKKEYVKWVYESYQMIGKAHFYKHDYLLAKQNFQFVATRYKIETIRYDAMMWNAMALIQEEEYDDARTLLDAVQNRVNQNRTSDDVVKMLPMVYAELYIKQKNYSAAVEPLRKAIKHNRKKNTRSRLYFILGQVLQEIGNSAESIEAYQRCIKLNPAYEMDFNARINMAKNYQAKDGGSRDIKRELFKMLKDPKNEEFRDQIYFVLAEVELKEKNRAQAKTFLKESVRTSVVNNKQKAFSSLQLAELYFEDKSYQAAQAYYDSTVLFMPQDYPGFDDLKERKDVLTELVVHLVTIQTQDSLQRIANMSEGQRNKVIQGLIAAEIERERQEAEAERQRQINMMRAQQESNEMQSVTQQGAAKWYFYNPSMVSKGIGIFQNKWEGRKLEDNWRISNKQSMSFGDDVDGDDEDSKQDSIQKKIAKDKKTPEFYMKDLPLTKEMMDSSNRMIEDAYFGLGVIYKDKLTNDDKAIESFEDLLKRFELTKYRPQAYYYLYQSYNFKNQTYDAKYYKDLLIKNFPESQYAKILNDPDYYKKLEEEGNKAKNRYGELYSLYAQGKYEEVFKQTTQAMKTLEMSKQQKAQFAMLKALSLGHTSDTIYFIGALETVRNDYPGTDVDTLAGLIVERLREGMRKAKEGNGQEVTGNDSGDGKGNGSSSSKGSTEETIYVYKAEETHMFIVVVDISTQKLNNYKIALDNHNKTYFAPEGLKVNSIPLNRNQVLVSVSNFSNKEKAIEYFNTLKHNKVLYGYLLNTGNNFFTIGDDNYKRLYRTKDIDSYKKFYNRYYK